MPDALPGQLYRSTIRDRRGNAIPSATVEVLISGTATVLDTVTTDADGNFAVALDDELADKLLVDLRVSGPIPTYTLTAVVLV